MTTAGDGGDLFRRRQPGEDLNGWLEYLVERSRQTNISMTAGVDQIAADCRSRAAALNCKRCMGDPDDPAWPLGDDRTAAVCTCELRCNRRECARHDFAQSGDCARCGVSFLDAAQVCPGRGPR